ncbi:hypothetical protein [Crateriforma spongiae]|uniref:hypothetical protein n=1 Tax=Crateriforma spongiae TaxID=2724528 RepID=UPI001447468D|nr:hypothetical protein [Crateriforma spongiae]
MLRAVAIGVAVIASIAIADRRYGDSLHSWRLSIEYRVGTNFVDTGQFANAFSDESGPTGWVAPIPTVLLGVVCKAMNHDEKRISFFVLLLNAFCLFLGAFFVANGDRVGFSVPVVIILLTAFGFERLLRYQPEILCVPAISLCFFSAGESSCRLLRLSKRKLLVAKYLSQSLAILISPIVGLALTVHSAVGFGRAHGRFVKTAFALSCVLSLGLVILCSVRNWWVVGLPGFVKTNGWYELYQSQVLDDDGVLDAITLDQHPISVNSRAHLDYCSVGEAQFIRQSRSRCIEAILRSPLEYLNRVVYRLASLVLGSFVFCGQLRHADVFRLMVFGAVHGTIAFHLVVHPNRKPSFDHAVFLIALLAAPYVLVSFYERYRIIFFPPVYVAFRLSIEALAGCWWRRGPAINPGM